jgi:hypothetical protein
MPSRSALVASACSRSGKGGVALADDGDVDALDGADQLQAHLAVQVRPPNTVTMPGIPRLQRAA